MKRMSIVQLHLWTYKRPVHWFQEQPSIRPIEPCYKPPLLFKKNSVIGRSLGAALGSATV